MNIFRVPLPTGEATLSYKINAAVMPYFTYQRGANGWQIARRSPHSVM